MRWELRLRAAERGVFKAVEMRRLLAQAGLEISAGKMSALWSTTTAPVSVRLDDLEVLCRVLRCDVAGLLVMDQAPGPAPGPFAPAAAAGVGPVGVAAEGGAGEALACDAGQAGWTSAAGAVRPSLPPV
ncbi:helix-turn-helix domain-containing protein [Streptomyces sp. NPDC002523]